MFEFAELFSYSDIGPKSQSPFNVNSKKLFRKIFRGKSRLPGACFSHLALLFSSFCLQQCIDCVLNLPLNESQCLVQAKQGVYTIMNRGEKKSPTRNPVCIRETLVRGVRSLPPPPPPQTKNPRYGMALFKTDQS